MARPLKKQRNLPPLCAAVKALRLRTGLTQQAFAAKLGIALVSVARYETGREPHGKVLYRLLKLAHELGEKGIFSLIEERIEEERRKDFDSLIPLVNSVAHQATDLIEAGQYEEAKKVLAGLFELADYTLTRERKKALNE